LNIASVILKLQEEYKKTNHGDFIRLLEEVFNKKLSYDDELILARIARRRGWNLCWEKKYESARICFCLALDVFEKYGEIFEAYKMKKGKAICEGALGFPQQAINTFSEMLRDIKKIEKSVSGPRDFNPQDEIMKIYFYLSIAHTKSNNLKEAEKCLKKATVSQGKNIRFQGLILQSRAKILNRQGKNKEAIELLRRAEEIFKSIRNSYKVINVREDIATVLHNLGNYAESIKQMNEVLDYYENNGIQDHWAYFHRAASLEHLGKLRDAQKDYRRAVETFERFRNDIRTDHFRRTFSSSRTIIYERAALNCLTTGDIEEAYSFLQRMKARSFIEMIASRDSYAVMPRELATELEKIRAEINERISLTDRDNNIVDITEISQLREREADIIRKAEQLAALKRKNFSLEPVGISTLQKRLPSRWLVLDFLVSEFKTIIFALTKNSVEFFELNIGESEIREITEIITDAVIDCGITADSVRYLKENALKWYLHRVSSRFPAKIMNKLIPECETLIIIPHACLHSFPFCLLKTSDGYLAEQKPIFYLDNIQRLRVRGINKAEKTLVVSNPTGDLFYAEEEGEKIFSVFSRGNCTLLKGKSARRKKVLEELARSRIFHFAGHAIIDEENPSISLTHLNFCFFSSNQVKILTANLH